MSGFLLGTNVSWELVKPRPEPGVTRWIEATDEPLVHLSVVTLGEIRRSGFSPKSEGVFTQDRLLKFARMGQTQSIS